MFSWSFSSESLSQDDWFRASRPLSGGLSLLRPLLINLLLFSLPQVLHPRYRLPHPLLELGVLEHAPALLQPGGDEPANVGKSGCLVRSSLCTSLDLKVYDYFTSTKGREEPHCRNSTKVSVLYDHLLFPLSVFSFLFTLLASFVNSLRSL